MDEEQRTKSKDHHIHQGSHLESIINEESTTTSYKRIYKDLNARIQEYRTKG
jgi:hypothetical protein